MDILSFDKGKQSWDLNTREKFQVASWKKEGNAFFKVRKYVKTFKSYEWVAKFINAYINGGFGQDKLMAIQLSSSLSGGSSGRRLLKSKEDKKISATASLGFLHYTSCPLPLSSQLHH